MIACGVLFFWRVHEKGAPLTKQAESHDEPIEPSERQASALLTTMAAISGTASSIRAATDSETFDLAGHDVSIFISGGE